MSTYLLPNHPSLTSIDPIGLCDDGEEEVPHWKLLQILLTQATEELEAIEKSESLDSQKAAWANRFCDLLEDIAYSLHGDHGLSTDGIKGAIRGGGLSVSVLRVFRMCLFRIALQLEVLFPSAEIGRLSTQSPAASFSPAQTDSLLAHLLLGTLQIPDGNTWGRPGFSQLFAGGEATKNTSLAYLKTVMMHFVGDGYNSSLEEGSNLYFRLMSGCDMPDLMTSEKMSEQVPITLVDLPSEPSDKNDAFVLIAANSQPGPGPAGTQEERIVGQSPALAIASLLTPVLGADEAVITSSFPVHAAWRGHGRRARRVELFARHERPKRRYIIADALPLDIEEDGCEARPENVQREVRKLYAAFSGAKQMWLEGGKMVEDMRIEMPPWGCGAFGGTLRVKVPCMMMAAALAGLKAESLELFVTKDREEELKELATKPTLVKELYSTVTSSS